MTQGTIIRVAGPVVDVQFTEGKLPALQEALTVTAEGTERTMEVTQHVNETTVRCIMLSASEGPDLALHITMFRTNTQCKIKPLPIRKPAYLFPQHSGTFYTYNICNFFILKDLLLTVKFP